MAPADDSAAALAPHTHYSAFTLALDFDQGNERLYPRLSRRVEGCNVCRSALEELTHWLTALDHADPLVGPEYVTRHVLFNQLLADRPNHPARLRAIDTDDLFHHWGLCRLLLDESAICRRVNPELSAQLAELALAIADRLDSDYYGCAHVADLQARAAADFGDALLLLNDARAAEEQLEMAWIRLSAGSGQTDLHSPLTRLEARLLRDLGQHDEACELLLDLLSSHEARRTCMPPLLRLVLESDAPPDQR